MAPRRNLQRSPRKPRLPLPPPRAPRVAFFLRVSASPKKQNGGLLQTKGLSRARPRASILFLPPPDWARAVNCSAVNVLLLLLPHIHLGNMEMSAQLRQRIQVYRPDDIHHCQLLRLRRDDRDARNLAALEPQVDLVGFAFGTLHAYNFRPLRRLQLL